MMCGRAEMDEKTRGGGVRVVHLPPAAVLAALSTPPLFPHNCALATSLLPRPPRCVNNSTALPVGYWQSG